MLDAHACVAVRGHTSGQTKPLHGGRTWQQHSSALPGGLGASARRGGAGGGEAGHLAQSVWQIRACGGGSHVPVIGAWNSRAACT